MKVLVLYDSKFDNTEKPAQAMAAALEATNEVRLRKVGGDPLEPAGLDLALVGGPTQGHSASPSLKTALKSMPGKSAAGVRAATFDTRFRMSRLLTGSAAVWAGKALKRRGATLVVPTESFYVTRTGVPELEPGEIERAADWARTVAGSV